MTNLGKRLRFLRLQRNLTQLELGEIMNISPSTIGMYERGEREPSYKTLMDLASFFQVSIDYLLDFNLDEKHSFPKLSKHEEKLLQLNQNYGDLFHYILNAEPDELKKLQLIIKLMK